MPTVIMGQRSFAVSGKQSLLDALLDQGESLPHSCRIGVCQTCLLRARKGTPPKESQVGLRDSLVAQNYFLPCIANIESTLEVELPDAQATSVPASIQSVEMLNDDVAKIELRVEADFAYRAGQYINLMREDGVARSYSIASLPTQLPLLELHVKQIAGGQMSSWLVGGDARGAPVRIRGPAGDCFYPSGDVTGNLLLVGTGTGLAPLIGIVRDALQSNHRGRIELYHGALREDGLYLVDELSSLASRYSNFQYHRCVLANETSPGVVHGALDQVVLSDLPSLKDWRVFLCGAPEFVLPMRKKVFLAGAHSKMIHADAFVMSSNRQ